MLDDDSIWTCIEAKLLRWQSKSIQNWAHWNSFQSNNPKVWLDSMVICNKQTTQKFSFILIWRSESFTQRICGMTHTNLIGWWKYLTSKSSCNIQRSAIDIAAMENVLKNTLIIQMKYIFHIHSDLLFKLVNSLSESAFSAEMKQSDQFNSP